MVLLRDIDIVAALLEGYAHAGELSRDDTQIVV